MVRDQPCPHCRVCFTQGAGFAAHTKACSRKHAAGFSSAQLPPPPPGQPRKHPLQSFVEGDRYHIPKRVPKAVRRQCARVLTELIRKCTRDNSSESWIDLLLFAPTALSLPPTKSLRRESLAAHIRKNLADPSLAKRQPVPRRDLPKHDELPPDRLRAQVTSMLQDGNIKGAIRVVLGDDKLAEINARTIELLRDKHPPAPDDCQFPADPDDSITPPAVTPVEMMATVFSFPSGSAGGVFGLRPQHLKDLLVRKDDTQSELCLALTDLATMVLRKNIPEDVRPYVFGANLIPLLKKDGGIRAIAVGETLRRLISKTHQQSLR
ncbi:uncharacterized protein LOC129602527 isoform X2 [Paramacrobiotus metropolitanus]|uniref:uncharacterized protein LOC129602527 isoform X2 n=1 Tax=Paramacrobiotus metropolitanus TaxID=2943436 RepID=UPI0024464CA8|nr:uncharacterized protein LOC129602527 isoform X2 [Paramacrobiotus metropolitanus]